MPEDEMEARNSLAKLLDEVGHQEVAKRVRAVLDRDVDKLILGLWHRSDDEKSEDIVEVLKERPRLFSDDETEVWKRRIRSQALSNHPGFLLGIEAYEALYESSPD
jgi:hypothetical protein